MANEGFLGKHVLNGERAATDHHPVILHHLPLSALGRAAPLAPGTVMKRVAEDDAAAWEPFLSTDAEAVAPVAVVDTPCDPTGDNGETSALCIVHGCAKVRLLKTGDGQPLTDGQMARLAEHGVFAV